MCKYQLGNQGCIMPENGKYRVKCSRGKAFSVVWFCLCSLGFSSFPSAFPLRLRNLHLGRMCFTVKLLRLQCLQVLFGLF